MRHRGFNRPPRVRPGWAAETVELPEPPAPPEPPRLEWASMLLPLAGAGVFAGAAGLGGGNPLLMALPTGVMALLGLGAGLHGQRRAARRAAAAHAERRALFEDQLELAVARLRRLHEQERAARCYLNPDPAELLLIAGATAGEAAPEPRLWERRPCDDDFLELRAGAGSVPAATQARIPPQAPGAPVDRRLYRAAADHATLRQVPIAVPLARLGSLGVAGPRAAAAALARALLWQAAVLHAPADLRVAALAAPESAAEWEWLRWLPHTVPLSSDPSPGARMVAGGAGAARLASELLELLSRRRERAARSPEAAHTPHMLVLADGAELPHAHPALMELLRHGGPLGMSALLLVPSWPQLPEACAAMLEVEGQGARWARAGEAWPRERFTPDRAEAAASDRLARRLAGVRPLEGGGAQAIPRSVRLFDLLGVRDEADLAPPRAWAEPPEAAWRPDVPIGAGADGAPVCLDLNEGRHGPHGIIAGATGAGKSVLLQTVIAALAATHGPERLQLLLIDFKGGAALMMFAPLPHTAGLVTDLEGRLAARAITALKSELRRRKGLLKDTAAAHGSKVENVRDYRALAARAGLPPLPNLLVVVDEFDELARGNPEFVAELVRVVKQGRSLGVSLLVATQQPARAVTDEIRSQLSYFVALRLGGAEDSREMLLKPDAAFLPADLPGRAYMRAAGEVQPLQVALVTGPYRPPSDERAAGPRVSFVRDGREQPVVAAQQPGQPHETDLDVLVRALSAAAAARGPAFPGWRPPQIWQPPLPPRLALGELMRLGPPEQAWRRPPGHSPLRQTVGLLDVPQEGRREPFALDLAAGHLAVVGAPGSGKSTLLRSLVLGLAAARSPRELWCYLVDAGGQGLGPLAGLPHVGAHILAREGERVRRLLRLLDGLIAERQELLRAADAADLADYAARSGRPLPAILVVIDKLAVLREELGDGSGDEALVGDLIRLARQGRPFGVHLALSADRAADLTYRLLALVETRVALRQPQLHDYGDLLGARVEAQIPAELPGRALVAHPDYGALELQVALPTLGAPEAEDGEAALDGDGVRDLRERAAALAAAWRAQGGPGDVGPPPVELLPDLVPLSSIEAAPAPAALAGLAAPLGRESLGLGVAWARLAAETPHALIVGPRRSGKTAALHSLARALAARNSPAELTLYLLDGPRGGLLPLRELPHTARYAADEQGAAALAEALREARAAGAGRRLVVVDDYTLARERLRGQLAQSYGGAPNLFELLLEIAQVGGQLGEHILLAAGVSYPDDALLRALDGGRSGLVLWPGRYDPGTRLLGAALPVADQRGAHQPPGRALLVGEDEHQIVQVALAHAAAQ